MPSFFANPAALWVLAGIPLILLIHFLQRKARRFPVSTLFLLDQSERSFSRGSRVDRIRNSHLLWLQIFCILLLAWILAEPQWIQKNSVQRIALVLDDSASMNAFRSPLQEALKRNLTSLTRSTKVEYTVLPSSPNRSTLYRGALTRDLLAAIEDWHPIASSHSPDTALRVGRSLVGDDGLLLFVSDHIISPLPSGALLLALGQPIPNVGFAGVRTEETDGKTLWSATLRNYSADEQTRTWRMISGDQQSEPQSVDLKPGEIRVLRGEFPAAQSQIRIQLDPDSFPLDDLLFLQRPKRKVLNLVSDAAEPAKSQLDKVTASLDSIELVASGEKADLHLATYDPLSPTAPPPRAIVFLNQQHAVRKFLGGRIVALRHSLMDDLDWQGLIARNSPSIPIKAGDTPLLWQGGRPLIFLRSHGDEQQLLFNFDLATSNASQLPAFVVLIHRYVETARIQKIASEQGNFELGQLLDLAHLTDKGSPPLQIVSNGKSQSLSISETRRLRAPDLPGFFRVAQGSTILLEAAANFADTREADFSQAASASEWTQLPSTVEERHSTGDPVWRLWVLLLAAILLATWLASREGGFTLAKRVPTVKIKTLQRLESFKK